jgi:tRNA pseudouridine55 synthase
MPGFLLIDKPSGPTSHDIINRLRRITGVKRIGHAGTLDPFASGLLIVAVGREATREIARFVKMDKVYEAELRLGAVSDTDDRTGNVQLKINNYELRIEDIETVIRAFIGNQKQIPPMYSAKKVGGRKLYELARKGVTIERKPADIEILDIKILEFNWPSLKLLVHCSSGTYVRVLARDIGEKLGCGAYLGGLRRIGIGEFSVEKSVRVDGLSAENWRERLF